MILNKFAVLLTFLLSSSKLYNSIQATGAQVMRLWLTTTPIGRELS